MNPNIRIYTVEVIGTNKSATDEYQVVIIPFYTDIEDFDVAASTQLHRLQMYTSI